MHAGKDEKVASDHPSVTDTMRGVLKKNPPMAKYRHQTWELKLLEEQLNALTPNEDLSNEDLWGKVIATCECLGLRLGDTVGIDPATVVCDDTRHTVRFTTIVKQSQGLFKTPKMLGFKEGPACLHCAVKELLRRRTLDAAPASLFVFGEGHTKEGKPVSTGWLRNCVKSVMDRAGVPPGFQPHSIRHAASTACFQKHGLATTVRAFGWASPQTFLKHYYGFTKADEEQARPDWAAPDEDDPAGKPSE
jgi:integrase